jgi:threonine dehydratase
VSERSELVGLDEIRAASARLAPVLRPTPTSRSDSLSARAARPLWLKHEELQRTGSFKLRGAYNLLSQLEPGVQVVAASAGNHAQGVALAARELGMAATIFMPPNVSLPKLQATRAYGAEVQLVGATVDDALVHAREFATATGAVFVPPFDDRRIIAGQGTIGLEVLEAVPDAAAVVVAVGGGGLCAGICAAVKQVAPHVRTVGVVASGADSMVRSRAAGRPVTVGARTIADGIAVGSPSTLTLAHIDAFVDELVAVDDDMISRALLLLAERAKCVVEPAGAAPVAAVLDGAAPGAVGAQVAGPVVAVLGGGNIDPLLLSKLYEHGLSVSGRFLRLRIVMDDRPGSLSELTRAVAERGLNIIDVEHHRTGLRLPVGGVEIVLTLETRDHAHQDEVVDTLRLLGYGVERDD